MVQRSDGRTFFGLHLYSAGRCYKNPISARGPAQCKYGPGMTCLAVVESSRTHFEVLGLQAPSPWPWPRSLRSSKIALSSARGQHYFLNRWNFVGKRQKSRGKFANTFFVFRNWSIGLAKRASPQLKLHQRQKCDKKAYCFFNFFLAFFAYTSSEQQYWRPGAPGSPQINFCLRI